MKNLKRGYINQFNTLVRKTLLENGFKSCPDPYSINRECYVNGCVLATIDDEISPILATYIKINGTKTNFLGWKIEEFPIFFQTQIKPKL